MPPVGLKTPIVGCYSNAIRRLLQGPGPPTANIRSLQGAASAAAAATGYWLWPSVGQGLRAIVALLSEYLKRIQNTLKTSLGTSLIRVQVRIQAQFRNEPLSSSSSFSLRFIIHLVSVLFHSSSHLPPVNNIIITLDLRLPKQPVHVTRSILVWTHPLPGVLNQPISSYLPS